LSLERLLEHRRLWSAKPVLASVYAVWFDALLAELPREARVLEVGAGPGLLSEYARGHRSDLRWAASDLTLAPWNDLQADAQRLPIRDASIDAVVGLDVVHHLARPRPFFEDAVRVLRRGGRIVAVEPWVTPLSYPVYRWLHQEGCRLGLDPWDPFHGRGGAEKDAFDGDAAVPLRLVRDTGTEAWRALGLRAPRLRPLNGFAYLLSLGFRSGSLLPRRLAPAFNRLDAATEAFARGTAFRALLVWTRAADAPTPAA
jgi:SAM-dependent methyltransferase